VDNTVFVRVSLFLGIFAIMAVLEAWLPARQSVLGRASRWKGNLSMVVLGALCSKVVLPASLVGVALWGDNAGIGVFNNVNMNHWVAIALCVLLLDMVIYWQHRLFHKIPLLWRIHKMHHADSHVDTTTGLRFHPIEIVLSLFIKAAVVTTFGIPAIAIVIFEVGLNGFALFNHANIRLTQKWDDRIGKVFITQRLHRIHHSQLKAESNSNFGFSVSWWDKLFGSFKSRATKPDEDIAIGQKDYPATNDNAGIIALLKMPFNR
jgi:sterol desaturase/sphingolipid hydroxylase (fatty acid hydroxylase superfamily)